MRFMGLISLREFAGGEDLVADSESCFGIDGLPPALDLPQAIGSGRVTDGDVTALFESVRDDAPVLAVPQPKSKFAQLAVSVQRAVDDFADGKGVRLTEIIDGVGEF